MFCTFALAKWKWQDLFLTHQCFKNLTITFLRARNGFRVALYRFSCKVRSLLLEGPLNDEIGVEKDVVFVG